MICIACGAECGDSNYCTECGSKRNTIIEAVKGFPDGLRETVERLAACVDREDGSISKGPMIMAAGDVVASGESKDLANARIYSTGSVVFSPSSRMFRLDMMHDGKVVQSASFYSAAAFRREWDDEKCVRIYTDYFTYTVNGDMLSENLMKSVSRRGTAVVRCRDSFYIYTCNGTPGYLSVNGAGWPSEEIREIPLNTEVSVGSGISFRLS